MQDIALYVAASLVVAVGIAHSYLGERYILMRLFRRDDLPRLFGSSEFTTRTLRFAWHITSVAWWGLAAVLVLLAHPPVTAHAIGWVIGGTFLVHFVIVVVASRGKHLSWPVFLAIGILVLVATRAWPSTVSGAPSPFRIVTTTASHVCVISEQPLSVGQPVLVILFDPPRSAHGHVSSVSEQPCPHDGELPGVANYVTLPEPITGDMEIGVAVLTPRATATRKGGRIELRNVFMKRDRVTVKRCASTEGLHFTAWRASSRVWH